MDGKCICVTSLLGAVALAIVFSISHFFNIGTFALTHHGGGRGLESLGRWWGSGETGEVGREWGAWGGVREVGKSGRWEGVGKSGRWGGEG